MTKVTSQALQIVGKGMAEKTSIQPDAENLLYIWSLRREGKTIGRT